jgi:hypothetical protein
VCEPIFADLESSVTTMAAAGPLDRQTALEPRTARSFAPSTRTGRLPQRCRVVSLPFFGEVTTTQSCNSHIPDFSTLEVQDHPELSTFWFGGLEKIPSPNNPGWFGFVNETCHCCGSLTECPDGSCIPHGASCTQQPA